MNRDRKIELLELLKTRQITPEQFSEEIQNEGKTKILVITKNVNGTYNCRGQINTKEEIDKLKAKFNSNRIINICPKNYNKS